MSMWTGASDELASYLAQREVERQRELINANSLQDRRIAAEERTYRKGRDVLEDERARRQDTLAEAREKRIDADRQQALDEAAKNNRFRVAQIEHQTAQPGGVTGAASDAFKRQDEFGMAGDTFKKIALPMATFKRPAQPAKDGEIARIATESKVDVGPAYQSLGGTEYQQKQREIEARVAAAALAAQEKAELQAERLRQQAIDAQRDRDLRGAIAAATAGQKGKLSEASEASILRNVGNDWARSSKGLTQAQTYQAHIQTGINQYDQNPVAAQDAVIYAYNKILDPTSVVRESEYARTAEGQSLLAKLEGLKQKYLSVKGGTIPKDTLQQLANVSGELVRNVEASVAPARYRATQVLRRYNLPEELVFEAPGVDEGEGKGKTTTTTTPAAPKTATDYISKYGGK